MQSKETERHSALTIAAAGLESTVINGKYKEYMMLYYDAVYKCLSVYI